MSDGGEARMRDGLEQFIGRVRGLELKGLGPCQESLEYLKRVQEEGRKGRPRPLRAMYEGLYVGEWLVWAMEAALAPGMGPREASDELLVEGLAYEFGEKCRQAALEASRVAKVDDLPEVQAIAAMPPMDCQAALEELVRRARDADTSVDLLAMTKTPEAQARLTTWAQVDAAHDAAWVWRRVAAVPVKHAGSPESWAQAVPAAAGGLASTKRRLAALGGIDATGYSEAYRRERRLVADHVRARVPFERFMRIVGLPALAGEGEV